MFRKITEFGETETSDLFERIDSFEQMVVTIRSQTKDGSAKQVKLEKDLKQLELEKFFF